LQHYGNISIRRRRRSHVLEENRRRNISGQGDITAGMKSRRSDGQSARDFDLGQWQWQFN